MNTLRDALKGPLKVGDYLSKALSLPRRFRLPEPGAAPGTIHVQPDAAPPRITVTSYGPADVIEREVAGIDEARAIVGQKPVTWINIDGFGSEDFLLQLGEKFDLHRLTLEDIVSVPQRPKVETYPRYAFIVTRMMTYDEGVQIEQVSMIVLDGCLITVQEKRGDVFDPVRKRIREGKGHLRHAGIGYLTYTLLDAVVDHCFPVLEEMSDVLETLEYEALHAPRKDTIERIYATKGHMLRMRRSVWPQRDMVHKLLHDDLSLFEAEDRVHLQDVYDHLLRVIDLIESYREMASGLMDVHLASVSNRMNEVMKVLTLFASIFIPLGFIAGLYGMNFDTASPWNMPELSWAFGYVFALGIMLLIALGLVIYFWRRGWLR